jgi:lipoyl(octanoyl) transferase
MSLLQIHDLRRIAFQDALDRQMRLVDDCKSARQDDREDIAHLLLLEHDPAVITIGRRGSSEDILLDEQALAERNVQVRQASRGGEVTWHGPGQLVGYAVVDLARRDRNVRGHVRLLEEAIIRTLAEFNITGYRREGFGYTGVWTEAGKIAAIGVAVHRWVTYHGLALNVCPDMHAFDMIVPCGLSGEKVTSLGDLADEPVTVAEVKQHLARHFAGLYEFDQVEHLPAGG